ncbi:MAG: hypothetical protein ACKVT2_23090 [Saprospiraceae bacterium]
MKKHIQLLAFLMLVIAASIYTACKKETIKSPDAQTFTEVTEGKFTCDFKVTDPKNNAIFTIHIASDEAKLVGLFNPLTVTARLNSPVEPADEFEGHSDDEAAPALPMGELTRVVIYVSRIEAPGADESTTYGMSFEQSLEGALKAAHAKMVVRLDKTEIGDISREKVYVSVPRIRIKGSPTATTRINWGPGGIFIHDLHVDFPINTSTWRYCKVCLPHHNYPDNKIKELEASYIKAWDGYRKCEE